MKNGGKENSDFLSNLRAIVGKQEQQQIVKPEETNDLNQEIQQPKPVQPKHNEQQNAMIAEFQRKRKVARQESAEMVMDEGNQSDNDKPRHQGQETFTHKRVENPSPQKKRQLRVKERMTKALQGMQSYKDSLSASFTKTPENAQQVVEQMQVLEDKGNKLSALLNIPAHYIPQAMRTDWQDMRKYFNEVHKSLLTKDEDKKTFLELFGKVGYEAGWRLGTGARDVVASPLKGAGHVGNALEGNMAQISWKNTKDGAGKVAYGVAKISQGGC